MDKDRRAFLKFTATGLGAVVLTACDPTGEKTQALEDAAKELPESLPSPSATITVENTPTKTATATSLPSNTPTFVPTSTETPAPVLPEGTVSYEWHDGFLYAIDPNDVPRYRENPFTKEWLPFTRPVGLSYHEFQMRNNEFPDELLEKISKEVEPNSITRLVDSEGSEVPFGYMSTQKEDSNSLPDYVLLSGIIRGYADFPHMGKPEVPFPWRGIIFETPGKFGRQQLVVSIPNYSPEFHHTGQSLNIEPDLSHPADVFISGEDGKDFKGLINWMRCLNNYVYSPRDAKSILAQLENNQVLIMFQLQKGSDTTPELFKQNVSVQLGKNSGWQINI